MKDFHTYSYKRFFHRNICAFVYDFLRIQQPVADRGRWILHVRHNGFVAATLPQGVGSDAVRCVPMAEGNGIYKRWEGQQPTGKHASGRQRHQPIQSLDR